MRTATSTLALISITGLLSGSAPLGCASYRGARFYVGGSTALERGDAVLAIAKLERAAELVPHGSEIQNHLGLAYLAQGREPDARAAFTRAVELDCDNGAARMNLAALRGANEEQP